MSCREHKTLCMVRDTPCEYMYAALHCHMLCLYVGRSIHALI